MENISDDYYVDSYENPDSDMKIVYYDEDGNILKAYDYYYYENGVEDDFIDDGWTHVTADKKATYTECELDFQYTKGYALRNWKYGINVGYWYFSKPELTSKQWKNVND